MSIRVDLTEERKFNRVCVSFQVASSASMAPGVFRGSWPCPAP